MELVGSGPALGIARGVSPPIARRGQWLRPVAILVALVFVVSMSAAWIRVAGGASHSLQAYRSPADPAVLTMAYPNQDLDTGDRILAVDGIPASEPAADDAFWRQRSAGDHLTLRVQRAATGQTEDVVVGVRPPLTDPAVFIIFAASTIWAIMWVAVPVFVALARPDEPAAGPYLLAGFAAGMSLPPVMWMNLPAPGWDLGTRIAYFLPAFSSVATFHQFLIFPTKHPMMHWLQRLGPVWRGRISVGVVLLYAVPTAFAFALAAGPLPTIGTALLIEIVCTVAALAVMIWNYRHPTSIFTRPQLVWIFWAYVATLVVAMALVALILVAGEPTSFIRAGVYLGWTLVPLATGFAILRYRLFDVGRVVRDSVTYGLLTGCLILGYFAITLGASEAINAVAGRVTTTWSVAAAALAAAVMALAATPIHRYLQAGLDRLVYRARSARRRYVQEANAVLGRAQPLEVLVRFLTDETAGHLDLTGAWLIVPENLRTGAEHLPASPEPLRQRLPTAHELTILTREDHSASGFPVLDGADPELAAWWEAGARLLVPLRAPAPEDRSKPGDTQNEPIGVWVLGTPRSGDLPEREDLEAIGRVGRQAAVLLDYARLNYEQIHQALINQDIKRALEVQQRLLPLAHPGWPGRLEFAARLQAARETSGDFYDVVDWTLAGGADAGPYPPLQIAVGDVRGKGMGAAVVMALAMSALRAGAELSPNRDRAFASPAATLALVSRQLHRSLGIRDFVCCALAVVEPMEDDRVRLRLANAGQVPPLLCRAGTVRELIPDGDALPLGVLSDPDYREMVVELQPDDVMIFASDGIVEAPCSEDGLGATTGLAFTNKVTGGTATLQRPKTGDQMFGFGRLARIASDCAAHYPSAEEVANNIWAAVSAWCGGQFPHDDVTLVVLRVPATADARGNASAEIGRLHPVEMPGT